MFSEKDKDTKSLLFAAVVISVLRIELSVI